MSDLLPPKVVTIEDLERVVGEVLLLSDKGIVRLICYSVIANALRYGPVWVTIIAPPSGGKSELLQSTFDLDKYIYPLSSLTPNTFISGMISHQKTTSLLDLIDGKTLVLKDLTTLVEMGKDERRAIMAQLREIYDGRFDKAFGTGQVKNWDGHIGVLGAITPDGARIFQSHGAMGERFISYRFKQADRRAVLERASQNQSKNMELQQLKLREAFNQYLEPRLEAARTLSDADKKIIIDKKTQEKIWDVTDFATLARSTVGLHWKTGHVEYVNPPEMPTRFAGQITGLMGAALFARAFDGKSPKKLDEIDEQLMVDVAWGSIQPYRADVIKLLASYSSGTSRAVASELGYQTETVKPWLHELAGLKVISRKSAHYGGGSDIWTMKEEHRKLVQKYEKLVDKGVDMTEADYVDDGDDPEWDAIGSVDPMAEELAATAVEMTEEQRAEVEAEQRAEEERREQLELGIKD